MVKNCQSCNKELSLDNFYKKSGRENQYFVNCIVCQRILNVKNANKHKLERQQYAKAWRINNIEKIKEKSQQYYLDNRIDIQKSHHKYYELNKNKINYKTKERYKNNKDKLIKQSTLRTIQRKKTDLNFKLRKDISNRIRALVKGIGKSKSTLELLGCNIDFLKKYFEQKFIKGMTWENQGKVWHIDHILPCASFDLIKTESQVKCFHYTNLQPLWATTEIARQFGDTISIGNCNKSDKILV